MTNLGIKKWELGWGGNRLGIFVTSLKRGQINSHISFTSLAPPSSRNAMAPLCDSFHQAAESPAIIIPSKPDALIISHKQLAFHTASFQKKLADLGVAPRSAVSIASLARAGYRAAA